MGLVAFIVLFASGTATASPGVAVSPQEGSTVYIGGREGYSGTGVFPVHADEPANPGSPGEPTLWAYCLEHDVDALTGVNGTVGDLGSYLGANHFSDPTVQSKVLWVLAHSYPALSLTEFGTAAGVPGIGRNDAIEATQYAIWRYTDLDYDASWAWENTDSETAYRYLLAGANASTGMTPAEAATTLSISVPGTPQEAGTIVGPFVVTTNRATVSVSVDPAATLTDQKGASLDPNSVVDGQALYLDLRGTNRSGTATITATAAGSAVTGHVVSVPTTPGGTPTAADHAQSVILVAPSDATTNAEAVARWNTGSGENGTGGEGETAGGGDNGSGGNGTGGEGNGSGGGDSGTGGDNSTGGDSGSGEGDNSTGGEGETAGGKDNSTGGGDNNTGGDTTGSTAGAMTPSAHPSVSVSPTPGGPLAETGSSGTGVIAGIAAALAVVGGGVLFTVRRRRSARR
ncbi:thioester domain-containing protein [Streptomyces uncialis]|uniref:thioester domain-containing protein n=1 Tax=Streptomyces uncialis TaxID=1048205 RepID=UPI0033D46A36